MRKKRIKSRGGKYVDCCYCGRETYKIPYFLKRFKNYFCSKKCYSESLKKNRPLKCLGCGKNFYVSISQERERNRHTCSLKCRELYKHRNMPRNRTRLERSVRPKKTKFKKNKPLGVRQLKVKLDKVFSDYIRNRDSWTCYTCGVKDFGARIHCGHFISRSHSSTRYDEMNCHAQCISCNLFKAGNYGEYSLRLIKDFGSEAFETLIKKGREIKQFTTKELEELIEVYKVKCDEVKKKQLDL